MTEIVDIDLDRIVSGPNQTRMHLDKVRIAELAADIKENGMLQPITVRSTGEGFEVVCGHRRLEAHNRIGAATIQCIVREMDDREALLAAIRENEHREDITAFDEARTYRRFLETGMSQRDLAKLLHISQAKISQRLALDRLPFYMEKALISRLITMKHLEMFLRLDRFLDAVGLNDDMKMIVHNNKMDEIIINKWSASDLGFAVDDYITAFYDDVEIHSVGSQMIHYGYNQLPDREKREQSIVRFKEMFHGKIPRKYEYLAITHHAKMGDFKGDDDY